MEQAGIKGISFNPLSSRWSVSLWDKLVAEGKAIYFNPLSSRWSVSRQGIISGRMIFAFQSAFIAVVCLTIDLHHYSYRKEGFQSAFIAVVCLTGIDVVV